MILVPELILIHIIATRIQENVYKCAYVNQGRLSRGAGGRIAPPKIVQKVQLRF